MNRRTFGIAIIGIALLILYSKIQHNRALDAHKKAAAAAEVARAQQKPQSGLLHLLPMIMANSDLKGTISFSSIVQATTKKSILPFSKDDAISQSILDHLTSSLPTVVARFNQADAPTRNLRRINEASRFFEDHLAVVLSEHEDFTCDFPQTQEGKTQRSGYPDLKLTHLPSGRVTYLDPKLFEQNNRGSSLRTFYFEPKTRTGKILDDAHHVLIGISHDGNDGEWKFLSWELVDLMNFEVRLKAEFQASNKDLYQDEFILQQGVVE